MAGCLNFGACKGLTCVLNEVHRLLRQNATECHVWQLHQLLYLSTALHLLHLQQPWKIALGDEVLRDATRGGAVTP